jgi:hypothetical protein
MVEAVAIANEGLSHLILAQQIMDQVRVTGSKACVGDWVFRTELPSAVTFSIPLNCAPA